jgi:hypothetical protein
MSTATAKRRLRGIPPWWNHPALVLLWKRDHADPHKWTCKYFLSMPRDYCDCRHEGGCVRTKMGETNCRMGRAEWTPLESDGSIYTPFRDGCHASWDAHQLGLPAYVVALGHVQEIQPKPFQGASSCPEPIPQS